MNILFMPSWYEMDEDTNAGSFFTEQAKALEKMGNNVTMAIIDILNYPYRCGSPKYRILKEVRHGIDVYRMIVPSLMTGHVPGVFFLYYAHYCKKLYRYLTSKGMAFDLIYAHSFWHAGYIGTILKKKYSIPLIVQEHRSMLMSGEFSEKVNKYLRETVIQADAFLCVSSRLRENVYKRTGLKDGIEVLPNMVDDLFHYQAINNRSFTYTFVGSLNTNKRILQLLRCFERVREDNPDVKLYIAGDGPLREQVKRTIDESPVLSCSVTVMGLLPRDEVFDLLGKTNVLILPSAFEPFGVVCIEALAVGRPVICTKNGSLDFINDSNGILIDVDSDDQLIEAMERVHEEYDKYDLGRIAENCKAEYSSNSIMEKLMKKMLEVKNGTDHVDHGD